MGHRHSHVPLPRAGRVTRARRTEPGAVLVIVGHDGFRDLILECLGNRPVTVASTPWEATTLLGAHRYPLVIATNGGIPPLLTLEAIPQEHDYPVFFLTGHWDAAVEAVCRDKRIAARRVPLDLDELRQELRIVLEDRSPLVSQFESGVG
jgi:hypothetical protein